MPDYPGAIKSFATLVDGVTAIVVAHPNERGDEIEAIETELGTNPADKTGGVATTYATVKARLDKAHRGATFVVAASDAPIDSRQFADYVCDGAADDVQIQAAVDALPAAGGSVLLSEGTFALDAQITRAIDSVAIIGSGTGTLLNLDASTAVISAGSQAGWWLCGFDTDAGGIDVASASDYLLGYWVSGKLKTQNVMILDRDLSQVEIVDDSDETAIYSHSIPAGALGAIGGVRLTLSGDYLNNSGSSRNMVIKVKLGSTTVLTSTSFSAAPTANRREWQLDILLLNSAVSAQKVTASFLMSDEDASNFHIHNSVATAGDMAGVGLGSASEDTSGALTLEITMKHSTAHANLSLRKEVALLELIPAA